MTENHWIPSDRKRQPGVKGKPLVDPAGWYPSDVQGNEHWAYQLSPAEIAEIESAEIGRAHV